LRLESARIAVKPPMPSGVTQASTPPVTAASRSPYLMARNASPIAWAPEEHALVVVKFAPL